MRGNPTFFAPKLECKCSGFPIRIFFFPTILLDMRPEALPHELCSMQQNKDGCCRPCRSRGAHAQGSQRPRFKPSPSLSWLCSLGILLRKTSITSDCSIWYGHLRG